MPPCFLLPMIDCTHAESEGSRIEDSRDQEFFFFSLYSERDYT